MVVGDIDMASKETVASRYVTNVHTNIMPDKNVLKKRFSHDESESYF